MDLQHYLRKTATQRCDIITGQEMNKLFSLRKIPVLMITSEA
jgi:hypothetical protein